LAFVLALAETFEAQGRHGKLRGPSDNVFGRQLGRVLQGKLLPVSSGSGWSLKRI